MGINRVDDKFYMHLKIAGKLRHEDYEIIAPMLDNAVAGIQAPNINARTTAGQALQY